MGSKIDGFLPTWDVAGEHQIEIQAPPSVVYENIRTLDMGKSWGIRQLFRVRGLPLGALTIEGIRQGRLEVSRAGEI
jgi:hypothetical protein